MTRTRAIAELFDPATGSSADSGAMGFMLSDHTATLLPSGKVLVTGGQTVFPGNGVTVEIYDPSTGLDYHGMSRCVRRAWVCGIDPYDRKPYEHRREWV